MNAVYKLIWNVSTGTWAVAHELAASRGKKTGRSRLAAAMTVALALPAGAAFAADSPAELQCKANESVFADGLRCEAVSRAATAGVGTATPLADPVPAPKPLDDSYLQVLENTTKARATAKGNAAIAIGSGAAVNGNSSTAIGNTASVVDDFGLALGMSANVSKYAGMALGSNTTATEEYSVAIGGAGNAGRGATSTAKYGVAIGVTSQATATNSVALGAGTLADRADTVSVGAANPNMDGKVFTRQIVNVADGTEANDAVNLGQMNTALSTKVDDTLFKANGSTAATLGGGNAIAIGSGAHADGSGAAYAAVAVGTEAEAIGNAAAFGASAKAATRGTAVGGNAQATGGWATSVGYLSTAENDNSTSLGFAAMAQADNSVALGASSVSDRENTVSIGSTDPTNGFTRQLVNMAAGTKDNDAVNVSQLKPIIDGLGGDAKIDANTGAVTGPTYSFDGQQFKDVGSALGNLDGRVAGNTTNLGDITTRVTNLESSGAGPGLVVVDANNDIAVANSVTGGKVNIRDSNGDSRTLTGVKGGTDNNDAVNVSQLKGVVSALGGSAAVDASGNIVAPTYTIGGADKRTVGDAFDAVDTSLTGLDGRVTTVEGNVTNLQGDITNIINGSVGLVQYDATNDVVTVAKDQDGATVDFTGKKGERTLSGVQAGVAATDAVNVGQLKGTAESVADALGGGATVGADGKVTAPSYDVGGTTVGSVGDAITNLDGRTTTNTNNLSDLTTVVNNLQAGVGGIVSYDAQAKTVKVAAVQGGDKVSFKGADGERRLTDVNAGVDATDAANMGQLKGTAQSIADGLGGGSVVNPDGTITAPSYSIGGSDYANVGDAFGAVDTSLTNLDGRVTVNEGNITNINSRLDGLADGTVGLVTYDAATKTVNVAADKDVSAVSFKGDDGSNRVLAGVADGKVEDGSDEAVNGSQLNATNERVAANETSITNLDGRVTTNEGDINNLTTQVTNLSNGSAGLVTQDALTGNINVASQLGGDVVDMAGTAGARRVSGVANGVDDTDVATVAQLKASGLVDPNDGRALGALVYDDLTLDRATLGGTNGTVLGNLGNGLIAAGSREAVNGGQLFQMNADWEAKWSQLDGRVGTIEQGIADGSIGGGSGGGSGGDAGNGLIGPGTGEGSLVVGDGSADGTGSVAVGGGAAGGEGSVAIGGDSSATGDNSVAIGNGSTADRDNEFSVGSEGNERIVSNVGAGVRPTDAVNVQQMNDRFEAERKYVDDRFHSVDKRFDRMGAMSSAYAGMAINTAGLTGDNRVGAGVGAQNGRTALAVGYQRILGEKKNVSVSLGGAFSGSDKSVSAGAGYSW